MPRVVAVVVHWRDPDATMACVASLSGEDVGVVVVENGLDAPVGDRLARGAPHAVCVRSPENRGYAGGANLGIAAARARGAEVVLLLNDDVRVQPGATAAALRVLDADARVAAVGAKVVTREDPGRLWLAWGEVTWRQSLVRLIGAGEPDGPRFARERDVTWIAGCAMWLRAAALEALGGLDEAFFAYHEEVEWCVRARAAGWRVVYCPAAVVSHTGRGGGAPASVRIRKYFAARNSVLFARRHGSAGQRLKLAAFLAASLPLELLWHLPRGDAEKVLLKIEGVRDGLLRRPPPLQALGLR
ncbi:MAG TPA: glycosyltransferase family 2 protein [Candidatus Binatia bacterium]|nr:glycosyltransferase family 2 protein [Candidatus Binatia bacterium]